MIKRRMRRTGHVARVGDGELHRGFWWGNLTERDHLEYLDIDGRVILKFIFKKSDGGMDWIDLAQDRDGRQALVNAVMNL
jgi:hypothetical protein